MIKYIMKPSSLIAIFLIAVIANSCKSGNTSQIKKEPIVNGLQKSEAVNKLKLKPVFGYRFSITGDFNGDGKKDTLTEHFFSGIDNKETNKYYENGNYDTLVALNAKKKTYCFLSCSNKNIRALNIASTPQLGIAYLKNEGDLNGDGTDEISYAVDWADWSNVNFCRVMTFKNNEWKEIYSFQIRDWQIPDRPQTYNQYGIAGLDDKIINTTNVTANKQIEKNLLDFKGFIKKLADNKIQVALITDDATPDTIVVDLKKKRR